MGNGIAFIDDGWIRHSHPGILAACPVRIAPAEELIWHRLFISERHRHDMSDIVHLILCLGDTLDWERLVDRVGENWPLLLSQVLMFSYVYPGYKSNIPAWVPEHLLERARAEFGANEEHVDVTRGPMISRFSFTIDVREWGFSDPRVRAGPRGAQASPRFAPSPKRTSGTSAERNGHKRRKNKPRNPEPALHSLADVHSQAARRPVARRSQDPAGDRIRRARARGARYPVDRRPPGRSRRAGAPRVARPPTRPS